MPDKLDIGLEDSAIPIEEVPNLNRIYVHPLFFIGGFILHTALSVIFALYAAPLIAGALGVTVATAALYWAVIALVILALALYRQHRMEGSILAR